MKSRLSDPGGIANPRDATRHRCGVRLALTRHASISSCAGIGEMGYLATESGGRVNDQRRFAVG
jgi:hypothetical protein